MSGYENYPEDAREIEVEIERKGVVLGIDWNDTAQVRALAREAIEHGSEYIRQAAADPSDYQLLAKVDLFGLAQLMLRTMEESAVAGIETHGGPAWKAFARALWAEAELHKPL